MITLKVTGALVKYDNTKKDLELEISLSLFACEIYCDLCCEILLFAV
jgi:hypothetical protein